MSDTKTNNPVPNFYRASAEDFKKIPGSPIAYWVSDSIIAIFQKNRVLSGFASIKHGMTTGNNDKFLRFWFEVPFKKIKFDCISCEECFESNCIWFPYNKGGIFRKWYGNRDYLVNYHKLGKDMKSGLSDGTNSGCRIVNEADFFKKSITWADVTSGPTAFRYCPPGSIFDGRGSSLFSNSDKYLNFILFFLNSNFAKFCLRMLNPTLVTTVSDIGNLPFIEDHNQNHSLNNLISLSKTDWDSYETSWDFTTLPLISPEYLSPTIEASYQKLRSHWQEMTTEMKELEEENNKIFIEAYGLQDELTPDVPLSEITLTCNPHYRYDASKPEEELEALLRTDTIKELISYAVGCMFGRYSLDKPGLILANQGETVEDYLKQVPHPTFRPDDDNIIPVLDDEYFPDDIVGRFKNFLKIVFGEKTLSQNLDYIAQALTGKSTPSPEKVIRDYFLKDFFKDHVQRYKKRPIYWMFSSGKQQGFNALIYMHRYNKTTLAKMRTDYLLELEAKLDAELTALSEDPVKNKARISKIKKQIDEMKTWDELLNNKALALIEIDLDDGVVVNYAKFKGLVRAI